MAFGGAIGWDFPAVLQLADAMGATTPLLIEMLPILEPLVLRAWRKDSSDGSDD